MLRGVVIARQRNLIWATPKRFLKRTFRFNVDCTEDGAETCGALGVKSSPTFLRYSKIQPSVQITQPETHSGTSTRMTIHFHVSRLQLVQAEISSRSVGTNSLRIHHDSLHRGGTFKDTRESLENT